MFNWTSKVEGNASLFFLVTTLQFLISIVRDAKQLLITGKMQSLEKRLAKFLRCPLILNKRFVLIWFLDSSFLQSTEALYSKLNE